MKTLRTLGLFGAALAMLPIALTAQSESLLQIHPRFVPDELIVALVEDLVSPDGGPTLEDFYAATGVTEIDVFPTFAAGERIARVRVNQGSLLGRSFRLIQTFEFGPDSRWSLRSVEPNFYGCLIPEGCPGTLEVSRVFNMSTRAEVRTGESVVIGGLIIPGEFARLVVFKVRGPSLETFGLNSVLQNPRVRLHQGDEMILENDDWGSLRSFELDLARQACPPPADPREAMMVTYLDPGAYTAIVSGADGEAGVALLEMYMVDAFRVESAVGP